MQGLIQILPGGTHTLALQCSDVTTKMLVNLYSILRNLPELC